MKPTESASSAFLRLRVVLVETSRPGNIGSVARAMKTMGFSDLVLVNPRFEGASGHEEAVAFASGAQDILAAARVVGSMAEALQGINFTAAVSARLREFSTPVVTPREFATQLAGHTPPARNETTGEEEDDSTFRDEVEEWIGAVVEGFCLRQHAAEAFVQFKKEAEEQNG